MASRSDGGNGWRLSSAAEILNFVNHAFIKSLSGWLAPDRLVATPAVADWRRHQPLLMRRPRSVEHRAARRRCEAFFRAPATHALRPCGRGTAAPLHAFESCGAPGRSVRCSYLPRSGAKGLETAP